MTRHRLLAIDDNPANLATLARALSDEFVLQLAASGEEGLRLAAAAPPDLILLDVMMPVIDGFETCRRLKADPLLAQVPVVFVTAVVDMSAEIEGLRLGAADYLHKPINIGIARQRIRNLLEREALRHELEQHRRDLERTIDVRTADLQATRLQAEAASRAKSAFLANMSHEIRSPLNAIVGLAALGLGTPGLMPPLADSLQRIHRSSRALLATVDDVLDFSRLEAHRLDLDTVDFELEAVAERVLDLFVPSAQARGIELLLDIDPAAPRRLLGDPARLGQVLDNLVGNAVKFTPAGHVVLSITCEKAPAPDTPVADAGPPSDEAPRPAARLHVAVRDTGTGLTETERGLLFEPFARAEAPGGRHEGGSGLGLAISQRLVERMGGRLSVDSAPGEGSTFAFAITLPVTAPATPQPDALALHGRRALVVSDAEASRHLLAQGLARLGLQPRESGSAQEALALLMTAAGDGDGGYGVVLADLGTPGVDGVDLLRRVRALAAEGRFAKPPRLVLASSNHDEAAARASADTPWDALLRKPVTASRLREAISKADGADRASPADAPSAARHEVAPAPREVRALLIAPAAEPAAMALRDTIARAGLQLTMADNAEQALALLTLTRCDLVLVLAGSPGADPLTTGRRIRTHPEHAGLPIVAIGGSSAPDDAGMREVFSALVPGPFDAPSPPSALVEALLAPLCRDAREGPPADAGPRHGIAAPVPEASFPAIDGIDSVDAHRRLAGNLGLFRYLLSHARRECGKALALVREALASERPATAARPIHALKGMLGDLGARPALDQINAVDTALRAADTAEARLAFDRLDDTIAALGVAIEDYLNAGKAPDGSTPTGADTAASAGARAALAHGALAELVGLLELNDAAAIDLHDSLRPALAARLGDAPAARLADAIDNLRFGQAAQWLREDAAVLLGSGGPPA
jgi:two-component system sensor histidine kinase/response regulator